MPPTTWLRPNQQDPNTSAPLGSFRTVGIEVFTTLLLLASRRRKRYVMWKSGFLFPALRWRLEWGVHLISGDP